VDTGLTSRYLLSVLRSRNPASLELCTLLDKSIRRIVPLEPRYVGFDCPDRFVVGYGLDLKDRYRNLASIMQIDDLEAFERDPDVLVPLLGDAAAA
jgi:hypoxanthine phosphoribosyltransferase